MPAHIRPLFEWFDLKLDISFCLHYFSSPVSGHCFFQMPAIYREPLCPLKVLPPTVSCLCTTSESVTSPSSLIQAHAPNQNPLTASDLTLPVSLCRLLQVPAGRWPFPTLSLQSLRRCLDPYPAVSSKCSCSLLPWRQRPHLRRHRFGTPKLPLQCNFNREFYLGAAVRQAHRPEHSRRAVIPLCSGSNPP